MCRPELCYLVRRLDLDQLELPCSLTLSMAQAFKADHVDPVGVIICKMDKHRGKLLRGYIAMLVVEKEERGKGIGRLHSILSIYLRLY